MFMEARIYFLVDDEEDRFKLSLAFGGLGLRKCIRFFTSSERLIRKLQQLALQDYPCLMGLNYRVSADKELDLFVTLKNHVQWRTIPVVLFCHNISEFSRQNLTTQGALACLDKASLYVNYMDMARELLEPIPMKTREKLFRVKCLL
jgi:hypothetical protein